MLLFPYLGGIIRHMSILSHLQWNGMCAVFIVPCLPPTQKKGGEKKYQQTVLARMLSFENCRTLISASTKDIVNQFNSFEVFNSQFTTSHQMACSWLLPLLLSPFSLEVPGRTYA